MKHIIKKSLAIGILILFILLVISPIVISINISNNKNSRPENLGDDKELFLLRGEHYLFVKANENVDSFHLKYAFPPDYGYQTPIFLEILKDTTADIISYKIVEDINEPNKFVEFTIGPMSKDENELLHFNYWVLAEKNDYKDLPKKVIIPDEDKLPDDTKKWLEPTEIVQSDTFLIKHKARQLKGFNNNLLFLAKKIAKFSRLHRYMFFLLEYTLQTYYAQDALTTFFINGECPGRSHLGCALFRANGVPARPVLTMPTFYNFWYEMHWMTEYYCPNYGWILTETHKGETPFGPENLIILKICYPEDENNAGVDFMFPKMTGLEQWLWIDNENVEPYWVDCNEGSKIRGFTENKVTTGYAEEAFYITKKVFSLYEFYLGMNLEGENLEHFQNAIDYQLNAIAVLDQGEPIDYILTMKQAYDEFNLIGSCILMYQIFGATSYQRSGMERIMPCC